jgi:hypothetical protein
MSYDVSEVSLNAVITPMFSFNISSETNSVGALVNVEAGGCIRNEGNDQSITVNVSYVVFILKPDVNKVSVIYSEIGEVDMYNCSFTSNVDVGRKFQNPSYTPTVTALTAEITYPVFVITGRSCTVLVWNCTFSSITSSVLNGSVIRASMWKSSNELSVNASVFTNCERVGRMKSTMVYVELVKDEGTTPLIPSVNISFVSFGYTTGSEPGIDRALKYVGGAIHICCHGESNSFALKTLIFENIHTASTYTEFSPILPWFTHVVLESNNLPSFPATLFDVSAQSLDKSRDVYYWGMTHELGEGQPNVPSKAEDFVSPRSASMYRYFFPLEKNQVVVKDGEAVNVDYCGSETFVFIIIFFFFFFYFSFFFCFWFANQITVVYIFFFL